MRNCKAKDCKPEMCTAYNTATEVRNSLLQHYYNYYSFTFAFNQENEAMALIIHVTDNNNSSQVIGGA